MAKSAEKVKRQKPASAAEETLRLGPLAGFIGYHLRLAQEASFQAFARRVRDFEVRPGRFAILALIGLNPGLSQTELGRAAGRDKSSLTPALNDLVRRSLVKRERLRSDRRSYSLTLTPKGEKLLEELLQHARAHDRELDQIVGLKNKTDFLRTLRRISMALV